MDELLQESTGLQELRDMAENSWELAKDFLGGLRADIPEARREDFDVSRNIPGLEGREVLVCGDPMDTGRRLDFSQGDNSLNALGDCGVNSAGNVLLMCGVEGVSEESMIRYAVDHGLCNYGFGVEPADAGGTTALQQRRLLEDHGVDARIYLGGHMSGSTEQLAARFEGGCTGIINLNAGYLWNDPDSVGDGTANHAVTMTGTVRDPESGELLGITVCDSGNPNPCRFISVEQMRQCYEQAGGTAVFTVKPARV